MINMAYRQTAKEQSGMKVIIEYPDCSDDNNKVKDEVRAILLSTLLEHRKKSS